MTVRFRAKAILQCHKRIAASTMLNLNKSHRAESIESAPLGESINAKILAQLVAERHGRLARTSGQKPDGDANGQSSSGLLRSGAKPRQRYRAFHEQLSRLMPGNATGAGLLSIDELSI
jgi:hypothetical protein